MKKKGVFIGWGVVAFIMGVVLILSNGFWFWKWREQYRVLRVIDGDTLVIKTGDRVRLIGMDAPEMGNCFSEESKTALERITLSKVIKIDRNDRDVWSRRLGVVYVGTNNVNLEMVKLGLARYDSFLGETSQEIKQAGEAAQREKVGIYNDLCLENNDQCGILGNIDQSTGRKYYHLPECYSYGKVKITPSRGEKVFCSVKEAEDEGFDIAPDCVR